MNWAGLRLDKNTDYGASNEDKKTNDNHMN